MRTLLLIAFTLLSYTLFSFAAPLYSIQIVEPRELAGQIEAREPASGSPFLSDMGSLLAGKNGGGSVGGTVGDGTGSNVGSPGGGTVNGLTKTTKAGKRNAFAQAGSVSMKSKKSDGANEGVAPDAIGLGRI